jgi:aspartyl-tRNA(Asn)/glutamyl-tRNA(Gln) amidotransferase subunit C
MQAPRSASDEDDVRRVARLARIALTESELPAVAAQFGRVLRAFQSLQSVDVTGIEPLTGATGLLDVLRPDRIAPSLPQDALLANAPQREGEFFGVPQTLTGAVGGGA